MIENGLTVTFKGPYNLHADSEDFLFRSTKSESEEAPYTFRSGIYILAWPYAQKYFPHYIGMTEGRLADRVDQHLRNFLSGYYYVYNRFYLDAACQDPESDPAHKYQKYVYGPPKQESFAAEFLPRLKDNLAMEIVSYIQNLAFFLAPISEATKEELLDLEAILTIQAYSGEARYVMDSPKPKRAFEDKKLKVQVKPGQILAGF